MRSVPYTRPTAVLHELDGAPRSAQRAFDTRLRTVLATLTASRTEAETAELTTAEAVDALADAVGRADDLLWLAASVLGAGLPSDEDMLDLLTRARLGGTWTALLPAVRGLAEQSRFRSVEVLTSTVTCDVATTVESDFLSGIQRVVRETTVRWEAAHDLEFLAWVGDRSGFRRLRVEEQQRLLGRSDTDGDAAGIAPMVVPWESTHLWVEVITDLRRTGRLLAMARHSRNEIGVLGFDSIPITSSATVAPAMTSHFARSLGAVRQTDRVAMISAAAAEEFRGVLDMGAGRRDVAAEVAAVPLAVSAAPTTDADLAEARAGLVAEDQPMVLVVGSHEPRKNHVAVLNAADLLWREGLRFTLVLMGAGSWRAEEFERALVELAAQGRPVQSLRGLPDRLLWAAYRLAHCTVFPSLNEGFGLPVAESLAAGTPVVTSDFGSMRDILAPDGEPHGGLLVDPRDDESLTDALRRLLTDAELHGRLTAEARQQRQRTWDEYADELWSFLVDGVRPAGR